MTLKSTASVDQVLSVLTEDEWMDARTVARRLGLTNGREVWVALVEACGLGRADYLPGGWRGRPKSIYRKRAS